MYMMMFVQGTVKQVLSCGDHEGSIIALTVSCQFLAAGTECGFVKMWDLSRRYNIHCTLDIVQSHINVF